MEEIQGLYAWGHDQDVGTFSKFSPFPAQPLYIGSCTIYHSWCLHPTASPPAPNLVFIFLMSERTSIAASVWMYSTLVWGRPRSLAGR